MKDFCENYLDVFSLLSNERNFPINLVVKNILIVSVHPKERFSKTSKKSGQNEKNVKQPWRYRHEYQA